MSVYYDSARAEIKEFFRVLEPEFPEWLNEYIDTREMLKQKYISTTCGTIYTDLFDSKFFYSSLDHSVGVALIVWHFTHDKKQTLAGLFHDIATPAFKHCVDFMNGDYLTQESTEDLTSKIIKDSPEIMRLLKRDKIKVSEVDNYHIYPIADNDTPKLSADRLEYSLTHGLFTYRETDFSAIKRIYNNITVLKDAEGNDELGFRTKKVAEEFVRLTSRLSIIYRDDKTRYSMQLIADILRGLERTEEISVADLYRMKEDEVMDLIERSRYKGAFLNWKKATEVKAAAEKPEGIYAINVTAKVRYIDPLVSDTEEEKGGRISAICEAAAEDIKENLAYDMNRWVWIDSVNI